MRSVTLGPYLGSCWGKFSDSGWTALEEEGTAASETFQRTLLQTYLQLTVEPRPSSGTLSSAELGEVRSLDVRGEGEVAGLACQEGEEEAGTASCFQEEVVELLGWPFSLGEVAVCSASHSGCWCRPGNSNYHYWSPLSLGPHLRHSVHGERRPALWAGADGGCWSALTEAFRRPWWRMTWWLEVVWGRWRRGLGGGMYRGLAWPGTEGRSGVWHTRLATGARRGRRGTVGFQPGANVVRGGTGTRWSTRGGILKY